MEPQSFSNFVLELQNGDFNEELSLRLNELVKAIDVTGKPGSLAIELKIRPNKNSNMVLVDPEIKLKLPKPDRPATLFFINPHDRKLQRHDPRQMRFEDLEVKKVSSPENQEVKKL